MPNNTRIERSVNYSYYADVLWCCVPLTLMSCFYYGARPALLMLTGLLTAYFCDCLITPLHGENYRSHEPSSECFAALIVLLMPASVPYYTVIAAVVVSVIAKETFGGEGHYPFHPAAVGMVVAGISWPQIVFRYPAPGVHLPLWDATGVAVSEGLNATLRSGGLPSDTTTNLLVGNVVGPLGACAVLVMLGCGFFLLVRGHLKLSVLIPFAIVYIGLPWLFPQLNELPAFSLPWEFVRQRIYLEKYMLLSGTAVFGGLFMACEPVTQPNRTSSRIVYGIVLAGVTVAFRYFSSYETSVCFALIIVGAIPEWLDRMGRRAERMKFMKKEEQRLAKQTKPQ